jgi:tripartite-type tricarboxylate transporter receptor subunit TctC
VENRPGVISIETAAKAQPDGYSLLMYTSAVWILPLIQNVTFNAVRDFSPVALTSAAPLFLFSNAALPVNSVRELTALARSKPGALNYGSAGTGTTNQLAAELFKSMASVDIVGVQYRGTAAAALGTVSGQVQMMFGSASLGMPQVKSGRLKVLGVGSLQPSALAPEVPTIASQGLAGYEAASMGCVLAPIRTPKPIVEQLNRGILQVINQPDVKARLLATGIEVIGLTPEKTAAYIRTDIAKWNQLVKAAHIHID